MTRASRAGTFAAMTNSADPSEKRVVDLESLAVILQRADETPLPFTMCHGIPLLHVNGAKTWHLVPPAVGRGQPAYPELATFEASDGLVFAGWEELLDGPAAAEWKELVDHINEVVATAYPDPVGYAQVDLDAPIWQARSLCGRTWTRMLVGNEAEEMLEVFNATEWFPRTSALCASCEYSWHGWDARLAAQ